MNQYKLFRATFSTTSGSHDGFSAACPFKMHSAQETPSGNRRLSLSSPPTLLRLKEAFTPKSIATCSRHFLPGGTFLT